MDSQASSIPQFCSAHNISRGLFYLLKKEGRAPAIMKVGRRTLISTDAAAAWRKRMESETLKRAAPSERGNDPAPDGARPRIHGDSYRVLPLLDRARIASARTGTTRDAKPLPRGRNRA